MAIVRVKFLATSIMMQMHLLVFLPETIANDPGKKLKTLWLLHGECGDCSDWTRLSLVEQYAQKANLALVMPNMDNSMYMDMAHGTYQYFTYLTEELPGHIRNLFQNLSPEKEDNFVAGVSVGGYGALKWMLKSPDMFARGACLSGDADIVSALCQKEKSGTLSEGWRIAFDSSGRIAQTQDDTFHLCKKLAEEKKPMPKLHMSCGEQDEAFALSEQTAKALRGAGMDIDFRHSAGGHDWGYWDGEIKNFIETISKSENREGE